MRKLMALMFITLIAVLSLGCEQSRPVQPSSSRDIELNTVADDTVRKQSVGQIVYVPCYSHIRLAKGQDYKLAINLSIRNTSLDESLKIESVEYYDSHGKLKKNHSAQTETLLAPLATADIFIPEDDMTGGSGANFLITWKSEKSISEPIIEAVMVGTGGGQGVSFTSVGRRLKEVDPE